MTTCRFVPEEVDVRLAELITEERVVLGLTAQTRTGVLREIVERGLIAGGPFSEDDTDRLVGVLEAREQLGSTGIKDGLAIPHGKIGGLTSLIACIATHPEGVPFGAMDNQNSRVFVTLLSPDGGSGDHLKALARVARLFGGGQLLPRLVKATSPAEALVAVSDQEAFLVTGPQ